MGRMRDLKNIIGEDRGLLNKPGGSERRGVILASCSWQVRVLGVSIRKDVVWMITGRLSHTVYDREPRPASPESARSKDLAVADQGTHQIYFIQTKEMITGFKNLYLI